MTTAPGRQLRRNIRGLWVVGLAVILVCFVGVGAWASYARLSAAAIAPGRISPDGSQRTVQHLEGGIVLKLNVREGDRVSRGQVLMVLDKALAEANYRSRFRKLQRLQVVRDRLQAQQRRDADFQVPPSRDLAVDPDYRQFVANEVATFRLKRKLVAEQLQIYDRQELQVLREIDGLKSQSRGLVDQLSFLAKEIAAKRKLLKKGLMRAPELYALERKSAELASENGALTSTIARARQKIEEIGIAKLSLHTEALDKVAEQLSQVNAEIAQAEEALNATDNVLARTDILSPVDGRVLRLNYKTLGGVVRPGEPIMTIVPDDEELIVEARLSPTDIDNVALGMAAKVQLTSFMARHMLPLEGAVVRIGADVVTDPDSREKYYPLRVRVDHSDLERIAGAGAITLQPGMPADVFVQTGTHTPLRYFADPILKSFNRAFREETL